MKTNATPATETTVSTPATEVAAVAVPKAPSKKSLAQVIFDEKMIEKSQGLYASNKEFRAAILGAIELDLGVSRASASTMYNSFKTEAEATGTVTLGRDPKKVKVAGTGKRGRPAGVPNKAKEVAPADAVAAEGSGIAVVAEPVAADAVA